MVRIHQIRSVHVPRLGRLPIREDACIFQPSGTTRTFQPSMTPDDSGFTEHHHCAHLTMFVLYNEQMDLEALGKLDKETVVIETTGGQRYSMENAFCSEPPKYNGKDIELHFISSKSVKL